MNKILKIFGILAIVAAPAFADDAPAARSVGERTDCDAVAAEINTLKNTEDPDETMLNRIAELEVLQRRDCTKNTARRRAMGRGGKMAAVIAAASAPVTEELVVADAPDETISSDVLTDAEIVAADTAVAETTTEIVTEPVTCDEIATQIDVLRSADTVDEERLNQLQIRYDDECIGTEISADAETVADLIASGLCADGTEPDSDGCCTGETLTDMGDGMFGCCLAEEGADCFPPIAKGEE